MAINDIGKTAPLPAVPSYAADESPAPAPALDAAFDASIEMLKRQQPKLRQLSASARGALRGLGPAMNALGRIGRRAGSAIAPATGVASRVFGRGGRQVGGWIKQTLTSRGSTVSMASAFIIAVAVLTFSAFRMTSGGAAHSQSRCPSGVAMDGKRPFGVLVDSLGSSPQGSDIAVHFDVCGLDEGTPFKVRMAVAREGRGHSADRMTASFDDTSIGTGTRRQHLLAVGGMPAGSYHLTVAVTDDKGRRRDKDLELRIVSR
jgi:hypothetical protein